MPIHIVIITTNILLASYTLSIMQVLAWIKISSSTRKIRCAEVLFDLDLSEGGPLATPVVVVWFKNTNMHTVYIYIGVR